jgi:hypothetical protein
MLTIHSDHRAPIAGRRPPGAPGRAGAAPGEAARVLAQLTAFAVYDGFGANPDELLIRLAGAVVSLPGSPEP